MFSVGIISPYLDLVNVLLNAIRDFGSVIKSCLKPGIFNTHERLVTTDGGAVYKVTSCRPRRGTLLICNMPVDKGVPCGSVSCTHTPAECQTYIQLTAVTLLEGANTVRDDKRAFFLLTFCSRAKFLPSTTARLVLSRHLMNLHVCVNKAKWAMPKREFEVVWRMFIHLPVDTGCQCCNHVNYSREHLYVCRWDYNGGHVHRWGGGQWPHGSLQFMHLNIMFFLMIRHIHSCGKLNIYNPF